MARNDNKLLALVAANVAGDLGPWSFYRSHTGKTVFYARMPALKPASPTQQIFRDKWKTIATAWHALTPTDRSKWQAIGKLTCLHITGYNLWTYWQLTHDTGTLQTLELASGIDLGI